MPQISAQDRDLMIRTVIGEAGDQPYDGQAAVAHVILNRLASGNKAYGAGPDAGVSDIIFKRNQFEGAPRPGLRRTQVDESSPTYKRAAAAVDDVLSGKTPDPTGGAIAFLNPDVTRRRRGGSLPDWASGPGMTIGDHTFYGGSGAPQAITQAVGSAEPGVPTSALPFTGQPAGGAPRAAAGGPDDVWNDYIAKGAPPAPNAAPPGQIPAGGSPDSVFNEWVAKQPPTATPAPVNSQVQAPGTAAAINPPVTVPAAGARFGVPDVVMGQAPKPDAADTLGTDVAAGMRQFQGPGAGNAAARFGLSTVRGVGDVAATLAQGIGWTGEKGGNILEQLGLISPESADRVRSWHSSINTKISADNEAYAKEFGTGFDPGRITGQVAGSAPFLEMAGIGAAAATPAKLASLIKTAPAWQRAAAIGSGFGAGTAAITSASSPDPLFDQIVEGGILGPIGAVAGKAMVGAGKAIGAPGVQTIVNRTIAKTMGVDGDRITPELVQEAQKGIAELRKQGTRDATREANSRAKMVKMVTDNDLHLAPSGDVPPGKLLDVVKGTYGNPVMAQGGQTATKAQKLAGAARVGTQYEGTGTGKTFGGMAKDVLVHQGLPVAIGGGLGVGAGFDPENIQKDLLYGVGAAGIALLASKGGRSAISKIKALNALTSAGVLPKSSNTVVDLAASAAGASSPRRKPHIEITVPANAQ